MSTPLTVAHGLSYAVALLTTIATLAGLTVPGLYRDSASLKAQAIGQDAITLVVCVPLLVGATIFSRRGSTAGRLMWLGALVYMTYTYAMAAMGIKYNPLYLVYVAIFSMSLFAFVMGMMNTDPSTVAQAFGERTPRRITAVYLIVVGVAVSLLWLSQLVPALIAGDVPLVMKTDEVDTLVIQTMDLGLLVPAFIIAGVLLWRSKPWGYLLASVMLVKGTTIGLAVLSMIVVMARKGVPVVLGQVVMFGVLTVFAVVLIVLFFRGIERRR